MAQRRRRKKIGEILLAQGLINQDVLDHAMEEHKRTGTSLGTVLVMMGHINQDTLESVLGLQLELSGQRKRLGEILVDQGFLTDAQIGQALDEQKRTGKQLGKVLVEKGFIEENKLLDVISAQIDVQRVILENINLDPAIVKLVPQEMARSYKVVPIFERDNILTVAMADPSNLRTLDHIKFKTGRDVEPMLATEKEILTALDRAYAAGGGNLQELFQGLIGDDKELELVKNQVEDEQLADEEGRQVVKIVNIIINEAVAAGASDIHLEPQETHLRLRYRIDGDLIEKPNIPAKLMSQIISRLKVLASMDIAEKRKPLDGRFTIKHNGKEVDLRVSSFPTMLRQRGVSEKIVMRILDPNANNIPLEKMGFQPKMYEIFEEMINMPDGIILVTGPTGSGKSSTLYSCVRKVLSPEVNIVTMEDPVEINIPGVSQGQINNLAGFTFAAGIRAILRQDPDIIMLGEMRDKETAEMAVQAALTGHLVFSTLHTNDSAGAFTRLLDMGLEPFLVSSCVKGVLAQRLVRRICPKCREEKIYPDDTLIRIGIRPGTRFFHGRGCKNCQGSGYRGRLGIFELMAPDENVRSMVLARESSDVIKNYAKTKGMITLRRDGLEKALQGLTTIEQVIAASQADT
ncbi:MAG TPA: ATPase, T2SS/T4P/T4SS family [Fibrobacteria bacterium]|nr:ATPase, T2SS/T4P/T4SS family [Fibrobacteria bacterium]